MNWLNLTLDSPEANLALDEALLQWHEEVEAACGILRFWESSSRFVVVGYGQAVTTEVNRTACREREVPILRRCTGGGTVVQGPGCLNYTLVLPVAELGSAGSVTETNRFIMERHRCLFADLLQAPVAVRGHTDLAVDQKKFSGNAQRRKRHSLLFHGTFLLRFDLAGLDELLPFPSIAPEYRAGRSHADFLTNLELPQKAVKHALRECWEADRPLDIGLQDEVERLVEAKYAQDAWNFRR